MISQTTIDELRLLAERYENASFLEADPSQFMHRVRGRNNQEVMAFIASSLSYGSRKQFLPKIEYLLSLSGGEVYDWVRSGAYDNIFREGNNESFYRLYSYGKYSKFLSALRLLLTEYNSLGGYVRQSSVDGLSAVNALCGFFSRYGVEPVIPKTAESCCKRLCMFLRWMVRDNSAVDLGIWSSMIDKRTLIIPLDTHVLHQACRLGLISSLSATMRNAQRLTHNLSEVFPDDPLKADFALFGYGVNTKQ